MLLKKLRGLPNGSKVRLVSHQEAYTDFKKLLPDLAKHMKVEDLPEYYVLPYTGAKSLARVRAAVGMMPGVRQVIGRQSSERRGNS